jgi:hypothetical protein
VISGCGKKTGLISKIIKGEIVLWILTIKHGCIFVHKTIYPTTMSEGKKRDI